MPPVPVKCPKCEKIPPRIKCSLERNGCIYLIDETDGEKA